jgi:hypothetical protein
MGSKQKKTRTLSVTPMVGQTKGISGKYTF